jgi:hypothetical protein
MEGDRSRLPVIAAEKKNKITNYKGFALNALSILTEMHG